MNKSSEPRRVGLDDDARGLLFRRRDQGILMAILVFCAMCIAFRNYQLWRVGQGVVDIDSLQPVPPEYVVDLNSAAWPELANLPGIGEVLAREVIDRRLQVGRYHSIDDLLAVPGIGERKLERIRSYLSVR